MNNASTITYNLTTIDWSAISAIASIATLVVNVIVIVSIYFSFRALQENRHTKESSILIWALGQFRDARPFMRDIFLNKGDQEWLQNNREATLNTIGMLQTVSYFATEGIIPKNRVADMWAKSFVEQWFYLGDYIEKFRDEIGEPRKAKDGAYYARSFEEFSEYCRSHLEEKFSTDWSYLNKSTKQKITPTSTDALQQAAPNERSQRSDP